jgi:hypothetical protein
LKLRVAYFGQYPRDTGASPVRPDPAAASARQAEKLDGIRRENDDRNPYWPDRSCIVTNLSRVISPSDR